MTWREGETESHALLASSEGRPPTITFKMAAIALFCRTRVFGREHSVHWRFVHGVHVQYGVPPCRKQEFSRFPSWRQWPEVGLNASRSTLAGCLRGTRHEP